MNQDERLVQSIKKGLTEHTFFGVHVLGKEAKAQVEKLVRENFSDVDRKRITIRVHK